MLFNLALKIKYNWFWKGIKHEIPLCCIMFFESAWTDSVKKEISDYSKTMHHLTNNEGIILCPDCLVNKINHSESSSVFSTFSS